MSTDNLCRLHQLFNVLNNRENSTLSNYHLCNSHKRQIKPFEVFDKKTDGKVTPKYLRTPTI
jgi:hypothetical protein